MECVTTDSGLKECQKDTVTTRTVKVPGADIYEDPPPPPPPINDKTTRLTNPTFDHACLTGDPHIRSFDGLRWDCQSVGEHIILKSTNTRRQIQGRFTRVGDRDVSVTHGVAIQDEGGEEVPLVQLTIPVANDRPALSKTLGQNDCKLQLFVDGIPYLLVDNVDGNTFSYSDDEVSISLQADKVTVIYLDSRFQVDVKMGYWNGCLLNTCVKLPGGDNENVIGILGTPEPEDPNIWNDWMTRTGEPVTVPNTQEIRVRKTGYEYCQNWCLKPEERALSLFKYNEEGYDFEYFSRCDLEYGTSLAEFIDTVTEEIAEYCGENLNCLMDAKEGGLPAAKSYKFEQQQLVGDTCKNEGASCESGCCAGTHCLTLGLEKFCTKKTEKDFQCMVSTRELGMESFTCRDVI